MRSVVVICLLVWLKCVSFAQKTDNIAITPQLVYGKMLKHSPKILFRVPDYSVGVAANVVYRTYGSQYWNSWQKYPELGVSFGYFHLGDDHILGSAFSLLPNISLKLGGADKTQFRFLVGTGVAYLTKKFDYTDNPLQTAIGSHINNITVLQFNWHRRISNEVKMLGGFGLTHFSNGSSKLPNLGINLVTAQLGLQWTPNVVVPSEYEVSDVDPDPTHRFGLSLHGGLAFVEQSLPGGPKYPVYIASLGGIYRLSKANQLLLGTEIEYHSADYYFLLRSTEASSEKIASQAASRHLVFVAEEFFFWPFSIMLQAGTYLDTDFDYRFGKIFTKLTSRYYFPEMYKTRVRFYGGVQLKAHKFAAEYISFGVGAML